ncbi:site-specific integrase [Alphaproteobacteria bacterium]|nr:site-specific integrase [Alphaproteobacteria bacterium]
MGCVRKRGKSWNAQVRIAGWRSFTKSFKSKSDAKLWIDELERKLHSAPIPDIPIDRKIALGELLIKYADEVSPSHKGCVAETCRLKSIARRWIGELDIRYLTKQHFIQYRDDRMTVVTGSSVGSELALMKRVLDTAVKKWGYGIPYNPIKDIEFPKGSTARTRRLVGDEKERLLIAASSQRNIYIAFIIEFAIETGMRRSEILKLRWCDVDLENGFASLYDTKNGEDRRVPLTRRCIEVLKTVPQTHEQVFPISATCLRLAWNRARKKAGITDLRFHDLRHEAVSRFFEMGMSVPEVALISGHKDVRQLFRYTHLNPENVFKKYEAF